MAVSESVSNDDWSFPKREKRQLPATSLHEMGMARQVLGYLDFDFIAVLASEIQMLAGHEFDTKRLLIELGKDWGIFLLLKANGDGERINPMDMAARSEFRVASWKKFMKQ